MNRVVHFEIQADDIERAKKFYQNSFGWKIEPWMKKDKDGMDYWGLITGDGPGIDGGMYERSDGSEDIRYYDCTIEVGDIDQAIKTVKANGGKILKEKMEIKGVGLFAGALDTEGNHFGILEAIPEMNN